MSAFPRVLWQFADAHSGTFVPTKLGARTTREAVIQIRNDAAFRHWICENATLQDVVYCRMALFAWFEAFEHASLEQKRSMTARLAAAPILCRILDNALEILELNLLPEK